MWRYSFWEDLAERSIRTAAQSAVAYLTVAGVTDAWTVDWRALAGIALLAGLLSSLTSLAAGRIGTKGTAAFTREATAPPVPAAGAPSTYGGAGL